MFTSAKLQRLPSVLRFVHQIAADLTCCDSSGSQGRSVVVLLPDGVDALDVSDIIRYELDRRHVRTDLIALTDYPELPPLDCMRAHFGLPEVPASCDELAAGGLGVLPEVLFLDCMEQLGAQQVEAWARFVRLWANAAHQRANRGEALGALCVVAPGRVLASLRDAGPQLFLTAHYWWGLPTPAETQLLWRERATTIADTQTARWRDHMLLSIAASDSALLDQLASSNGCTTEIVAALERYALARGWTTAALERAGGQVLAAVDQQVLAEGPRPGDPHMALWSMGALIATPEYGVELHPAALIPLGLSDELEHRLWRAQAALLLPLIDRVRRQICRQLTAEYGPEWPWRYAAPPDEHEHELVRQSPVHCGLGHLFYLLQPQGHLRKQAQLHPLVHHARDVRNRLAHYQTVSLEEYLGLVQHIEQRPLRSRP